MAPQITIIQKDAKTEIFPRALQNSFAGSAEEMLGRVADYFDSALAKKFDNDLTASLQKGGRISYTLNGERLVLDGCNGSVVEYSNASGALIRFGKIKLEDGLYLAHRIELSLPQEKISSEIEIKNYHLNETLPENVFSTDNLQ
jgi:hypothetical protein